MASGQWIFEVRAGDERLFVDVGLGMCGAQTPTRVHCAGEGNEAASPSTQSHQRRVRIAGAEGQAATLKFAGGL